MMNVNQIDGGRFMKSKDQKAGFRRVPGGYRRSDVNDFILSNDRKMASICEDKDAEIIRLQKELADVTAECDAMSAKLAETEKALDAAQKENNEILSEVAALRQKLEAAEAPGCPVRAEETVASGDGQLTAAKVPTSQRTPAAKAESKKRSYTIAFPFFKKTKR